MIIKAIIKSIPEAGKNEFTVRVPFMEDNTSHEFIMPALLCTQPGQSYGYKVDDVVFVSFENDKLDTAIILGKLYVQPEEDPNNQLVVNGLKVTGSAKLPSNVTLGDYSAADIFKLYQAVESLEDKIDYSINGAISSSY